MPADTDLQTRVADLENRLAIAVRLRTELGDQVAGLLELLERSREEIRWLRTQIPAS